MLTSNYSSGAATYTTIPISTGDVVSRSFRSFTSSISRHRPWLEFIDFGAFDIPESISAALDRVKKNARYFFVNYAIAISICAALSLIGSPFSLIVVAVVCRLWSLLYFFREDPLLVFGRVVGDRLVLTGLIVVTVIVVWWLGVVSNLLWGTAIGIDASIVHGVFRNPQGLFLDEDEAFSDGLISSGSSQRPATLPKGSEIP
uniref:PRA1 family protein n=1 Tax=Kalanchoe fedtschenkoi TaxID=63787 RepID=A0A7N0RCB8_KALFE